MNECVAEAVEGNQKAEKNEREVDKEYLALLERKLHSVKNPSGKKATVKQFISDIASVKDHQLFNLLTAESADASNAEDPFVDQVIQPSLIQRKLAPQTCAISASEKIKLLKSDHVQKLFEQLEPELEKKANGEGEEVVALEEVGEEKKETKEAKKEESTGEEVKVSPAGEWAQFDLAFGKEEVEKSKKE